MKAKFFMAAFLMLVMFIPTASSFAAVCGDVDNSGGVNILDVVYLINFLYKHGPTPSFYRGADGIVTDVDGNQYPTITIGNVIDVNSSGSTNILDVTYLISFMYMSGPALYCPAPQEWMAENLKVIHYQNGDPVPNITDGTAWGNLTTGAYCEYNNDSNNVITYSRLYNWFAATDSRNIAPVGWHVPSDAEWQALSEALGGTRFSAVRLKSADLTLWDSSATISTNESGFTALPGGSREGRIYKYMGKVASFWTATDEDGLTAWYRYIWYFGTVTSYDNYSKNLGLSLRCVKDYGNPNKNINIKKFGD